MDLILQIVSGSSIAAVVFLAALWILKKTFGELIKDTFKKEMINYSEQIRKNTETTLSNHRHSLTIELAKLSSDLAVSAETYKLAAQHRYKIIEVTWMLFKNLQFDLNVAYDNDEPAQKEAFTNNLQKVFMNLYNDRVYFSRETYERLETLFNKSFQHTDEAIINESLPAYQENQDVLNELLDILRHEMGSKLK